MQECLGYPSQGLRHSQEWLCYPHSYLSATMGSTFDARRAGR